MRVSLCFLEDETFSRHQRTRVKHASVLLTPNEAYGLLSKLCVRFGFCLDSDDIYKLCAAPPTDIDSFTEAALTAEGYGYTKSDDLCKAARDVVAQAFIDHLAKADS